MKWKTSNHILTYEINAEVTQCNAHATHLAFWMIGRKFNIVYVMEVSNSREMHWTGIQLLKRKKNKTKHQAAQWIDWINVVFYCNTKYMNLMLYITMTAATFYLSWIQLRATLKCICEKMFFFSIICLVCRWKLIWVSISCYCFEYLFCFSNFAYYA